MFSFLRNKMRKTKPGSSNGEASRATAGTKEQNRKPREKMITTTTTTTDEDDDNNTTTTMSSTPPLKPSLQAELDLLSIQMVDATPQEVMDVLIDNAEKWAAYGIAERAIKEGDLAPHFRLPDAKHGQNETSIQELLMNGPVVVTFYRGEVSFDKICHVTVTPALAHVNK